MFYANQCIFATEYNPDRILNSFSFLFYTLFVVCSLISGEIPSAMILSEDKCPECEDIAGIASHASNPVFSVDHGSYDSGSLAFKMHPSPEDTNSFFVDILTYFQWRNFIIIHDGGNGKFFLMYFRFDNLVHLYLTA